MALLSLSNMIDPCLTASLEPTKRLPIEHMECPQQLQKDSGLVYIARNAARHPDSPVEPLSRSLCIEQPSFDFTSVDIVTDETIFESF